MFKFNKIESTFAKAINPIKNDKGEIVSADRMPIPKFDYSFNLDLVLNADKQKELVQALLVKQVKEIVQSHEALKTCKAEDYKPLLEKLISEVTGQEVWDSLLGENGGGVFGLAKFKSWAAEVFNQVKETYKKKNGKELDKQLASVYMSAFAQGQSMPVEVKGQVFSWVDKFGLADETTIKAVEWLSKEPAAKPAIPSSLI